jgi:hypothetical protein
MGGKSNTRSKLIASISAQGTLFYKRQHQMSDVRAKSLALLLHIRKSHTQVPAC